MTPDQILKDVLNIDPRTAKFIYGGLGVLAAAAIAIGFISDISDAAWAASLMLALSAATAIIVRIINDTRMRAVLSWIAISLFGIWTLGLVESAVRITEKLPYTPCYVRILIEMPDACEARLSQVTEVVGAEDVFNMVPAENGEARIWLAQAQVGTNGTTLAQQSTGSVFVQFGPKIRRPDVVDLGAQLIGEGWKVEGADEGGEQVRSVPNQNEVRYFHPNDSEAARALAQSLYDLIPDSPVYVRDFSRLGTFVPKGQLEIWLNEL